MERRDLVGLDERLYEAEQRGLAHVARLELTRERDLVQPKARVARGAVQQRLRVLVGLVLGDGQADALLGLERQGPIAQLRAVARVGAQRGRRAGQHADEVRELSARRESTLQHGKAALGRRELVVDLEPALLRLHYFTFG